MTELEKQQLLKPMERIFPQLVKQTNDKDKAYNDLIKDTPAEDLFNQLFK